MARKPARLAVDPLDMPPPTPEELATNREIIRSLEEATIRLRRRNLDNAVRLAQAVALGQEPTMPRLVELGLVDHFCELGRRFGHVLNEPPPEPTLRTWWTSITAQLPKPVSWVRPPSRPKPLSK